MKMFEPLIKGFMPVLKENLSSGAIDEFICEMQSGIPLEDGESEALFVVTTKGEKAYIATMATSATNGQLTRMINRMKLTDFITELLKKI